MWFPYFAMILVVVAYAEGYSVGAPESACKDMIPRHPVPPQKKASPYIITTSTKEVKAGTPMQVTISGKTANDTIRGIMLQARAGDKIVGTFKVDPNHPLAQTMNCGVDGDTVTHKKHEHKDDQQTVTFTWTPPADFNDIIKFRATIALNGAVFWVGEESAPIKVTQ
ncbi:putative defense protein Hdd11 [Vanessa atalanta]|uniref:putative defense protein Hdd11 n=1 Tax=Vanessa atalanta TaxID=42275 RepID=UPI001FCDEB13|nr:putative defense protein Hdd11 [Vanessa atalanta]